MLEDLAVGDPAGKEEGRIGGGPRPVLQPGRKAVVYVTSQPFLYPTLVSAAGVERQCDPRTTDVLICLVDIDADAEARARDFCTAHRITLLRLDSRLFSLPEGVEMLASHVPAASLARLVLEEALDPVYDRILYLDGDTLVCGDLRPLLAFDPPKGRIGAVRGSVWLDVLPGQGGEREAYVRRLGLAHPESYFNAGVLSLWRSDLRERGGEAFDFFVRNAPICRYHDQSALNRVFDGRVSELWPGFNYHVPYQDLLPPSRAQPALVHFTGPFKPWTARAGRFAPFTRDYDAFDLEWPSLAPLRLRLSPQQERAAAGRLFRAAVRDRLRWRSRWVRRRRLLGYLAAFEGDVALGRTAGIAVPFDIRACPAS